MQITPTSSLSPRSIATQAATAPHSAEKFSSFTAAIMPPIKLLMDPINNNKLVELLLTDFVGFVAPRTYIDASQRGADAGREVFSREMMGTLTNTYLCGWLMIPMIWLMEKAQLNPKAVSMRAWIDAGMLNHFSKVSNKVLKEAKDFKDVQRLFLDNILSRVQSTDGVYTLDQFKSFFPDKGKLSATVKEQIIDELTGENGVLSTLQAHPNIDKEVGRFLNSAASSQAVLEQAKRHAIEDFLSSRNLQQVYQLTPRQYKRMREVITETQANLSKVQAKSTRQILTKAIRGSESPFISYLSNLAIEQGGLTQNVTLLRTNGLSDIFLGIRSVPELMGKLKYFLEEYLTPAMIHENRLLKETITPALRKQVRDKLFHVDGKTWLERYILPLSKDGLIPYSIKMKRPILLAPLIATIAVGSAFVLVNNWITRRKYNGQDFFPGEGLPDELKLSPQDKEANRAH